MLAEDCPGRPLLIAEHGVGTDDDDWRSDVLRESLDEVERAIDDGIDVRGFFHWTGVDNYEWHRGFDVPFGLFDRDRDAEPKRGTRSRGRPASQLTPHRRSVGVAFVAPRVVAQRHFHEHSREGGQRRAR